ncbi:892_t:CDS:10 [Acaulospora morrowiae]|uniref:892_t:CDS:1 n=1 Tax=Acaulospora morrowiae TaxID=94023 RepID=A0A9N8V764_9GLOM|nr:892_t:CDS:10 [Acaulospora morrowiae]
MEDSNEEIKDIAIQDMPSELQQIENESKEPKIYSENEDLEKSHEKGTCEGYSSKININGQNVLIVKNEDDVVSGKLAPNCCVIGSPEHVAVLKAKIDELKLNTQNYDKERARLEQERTEAQSRAEEVGRQLDKLVAELKQLGQGDTDSDQTIHATVHTYGHLRKLEIIADEEEEEDNYERLIRKPRVRQYWHAGTLYRESEERSSSYTELFWDLIFAAVVQNSGDALVEDISASNKANVSLSYPIFRVWLDVHSYLNIYSSEDLIEKFLLLWEMVLVVVMGTHAFDIFENTSIIYTTSYVMARMTFVVLFLSFAVQLPMFRASLITQIWGIFIPCVFWIISIFVPHEQKLIVMCHDFEKVDDILEKTKEPTVTNVIIEKPHLAMKTKGTEYQMSWKDLFLIFKNPKYKQALNIEHGSERLGIFAIICLGEGMFGVVYSSNNSRPDWILGKAIFGLILAYNLHWIYFDVDASRQYQHALRRHVVTGLCFVMIHFPLNVSLIAFGSSLKQVVQIRDFSGADSIPIFENSHTTESHSFPMNLQWLHCCSLAVVMYCFAIIGVLHRGLDNVNTLRISKRYRICLRFVVATIYVFLPLAELNTVNLMAITSSISLFLVIVETYGRLRKDAPLFFNCDEDIIDNGDYKKVHRRYVRWRWGSTDLNRKGWTSGILKKKKPNESDNTINEEVTKDNEVGVVLVDYEDESRHL